MTKILAVLTLAILAGCQADREIANLTATLPVAATTGNATQLAECMRTDAAGAAVPEGAKADLVARADVLDAHARSLAGAVRRYDPAGRENRSITLANLQERGAALEAEYAAAFREWQIWQARHGLRQPKDVHELPPSLAAGR